MLCVRPPADPQALGAGEADQATLDCQGNPLTTGHQGWEPSLPPNTHPDPPATLHHASVPSEFCRARLAMTHIPKVGLVHRSASVHRADLAAPPATISGSGAPDRHTLLWSHGGSPAIWPVDGGWLVTPAPPPLNCPLPPPGFSTRAPSGCPSGPCSLSGLGYLPSLWPSGLGTGPTRGTSPCPWFAQAAPEHPPIREPLGQPAASYQD